MDQFQRAYRFSHEWFLDESGKDVLLTDGICFGLIAQIYVYQKYLDVLAGRRRTGFVSKESILYLLKEHHVDWGLRRFLSHVDLRHRLVSRVLRAADYLFVYDVHNSGMIQTLHCVQEKVAKSGTTVALTFEPRVYREVGERGIVHRFLFATQPNLWDRDASRQLAKGFREAYRGHRDLLCARVTRELGGAGRTMMRWLDRLAARFYGELASDYYRLKGLLDTCQPLCVVAASDSHRYSRLITLMARQHSIRTLVVQHGATVSPHAYVPVYADRIAVWGDTSRRWFIGHGVPEKQIVVTGQPRFDGVQPSADESWPREPLSQTQASLLLATNPIGAGPNAELWGIVCEALRSLRYKGRLVLKPHPGQSDCDLFRRLVDQSGLPWEIAPSHADLNTLISTSTTVITTQSTVGIEALIHDKPLVVVDLPGIQATIPYHEYHCSFTAKDSTELAEALAKALSRSDEVVRHRVGARRFLADYLYRLDGQASSRIADLITGATATETPA